VLFTEPETYGGTIAEGIAHIGYGVDTVSITNTGRGYKYPILKFSAPELAGGKLPIAALTTSSAGAITAVDVVQSGSGYIHPPLVTIIESAPTTYNVYPLEAGSSVNTFNVRVVQYPQIISIAVGNIITLVYNNVAYRRSVVGAGAPPDTQGVWQIMLDSPISYDTSTAITVITATYLATPLVAGTNTQTIKFSLVPYPRVSQQLPGDTIEYIDGSGVLQTRIIDSSELDPTDPTQKTWIITTLAPSTFTTSTVMTLITEQIPAVFVSNLTETGYIGAIEVTNPGSGYINPPVVYIQTPVKTASIPPTLVVNCINTSGAVGTVRRTNQNTKTWLASQFNIEDQTIYVNDISKLVYIYNYTESVQENQYGVYNIELPPSIDYNTISYIKVSTQGVPIDPRYYYVDLSGIIPGAPADQFLTQETPGDGIPRIIFTGIVSLGTVVDVVIAEGNKIKLNSEIIGFTQIDIENNSIYGLQRGLNGTSRLTYDVPQYNVVQGLSSSDILPVYYWTSAWFDQIRGPLQTSTNPAALFLKQ
jgi:hypothetical protein